MSVREHCLDVSELEPPEPLWRVLAALEELAPGERLRVLHRREPFLLYPQLEELGFAYRTGPGRGTPIEILIWRAGEAAEGEC
jgi:uncharacterized protein (DUF2249 family)